MRLNFLRINDCELGPEQYRIDFYTSTSRAGKEYSGVCLKNSKNDEFILSEYQLASLRIAKGAVTCQWFDDFPSDPQGSRLQTILLEMEEAKRDLLAMRFEVAYQLKVRNVTPGLPADTPVYKDFCYEGAAEYTKSVRALTKGKDAEFFKSPEYSNAMFEYRTILHATPLKPSKIMEKNIVKLPVFRIVGGM